MIILYTFLIVIYYKLFMHYHTLYSLLTFVVQSFMSLLTFSTASFTSSLVTVWLLLRVFSNTTMISLACQLHHIFTDYRDKGFATPSKFESLHPKALDYILVNFCPSSKYSNSSAPSSSIKPHLTLYLTQLYKITQTQH